MTWTAGCGKYVTYTEDREAYKEMVGIRRVEWNGTYSRYGRDFAWQVRYPGVLKASVLWVLKRCSQPQKCRSREAQEPTLSEGTNLQWRPLEPLRSEGSR